MILENFKEMTANSVILPTSDKKSFIVFGSETSLITKKSLTIVICVNSTYATTTSEAMHPGPGTK